MKRPEELKQYIKDVESKKVPFRRFAETLQLDNGIIVLRIWCLRFNKKDKHPLVKEVFRQTEKSMYCSSDIYFTGLGGYQVVWEDKKSSYYVTAHPLNKMLKYEGEKFNIDSQKLWTLEQLKSYDPELKYMQNTSGDIIKYIKRWKKYPSLEILEKTGLDYFWTDERVLKLKGKKQKEFVSWIKSNKAFVLDYHPSYNVISGCIKRKCTPRELQEQLNIELIQRRLKDFDVDYETSKDIYKYLSRNRVNYYSVIESLRYYKDYLSLCRNLGQDIHSRGVLFPKDFLTLHDEMEKFVEEEKSKDIDKKMAEVSKKLEEISIERKGLKIVIPKSQKALIRVGEILNNCVGRCNYGRDVAEGKILILTVCKKGNPVECCELAKRDNTLTLQQLRGNHNQDSKYHSDALKVVRKFIDVYTKNNYSMQLS